jgi:rare lipoprotein A
MRVASPHNLNNQQELHVSFFDDIMGALLHGFAGRPSTTRGYRNNAKIARAIRFGSFIVFATSLPTAPVTADPLYGIASVYAYETEKTANGETANPRGLTAAHRTLPFGTRVQVTNNRNSKTVVVRINDRGPFMKGRVIDVTPVAATALGFSGLAPVTLLVVIK